MHSYLNVSENKKITQSLRTLCDYLIIEATNKNISEVNNVRDTRSTILHAHNLFDYVVHKIIEFICFELACSDNSENDHCVQFVLLRPFLARHGQLYLSVFIFSHMMLIHFYDHRIFYLQQKRLSGALIPTTLKRLPPF